MHAPRTSFRPRSAVLIATIALAAAPGAAGDKGEERAAAGRRSGNYLIVLAEAYAYTSPMLQFINTKTMQGFNVMTYVVPPGTTNATIKAHIQSLWGTPEAPDYILLVGDTDGDTSTATTIPHWTGQASRHACTDLPYACMDPGDDWQPEIPIGRFSVRSEGMLRDVVHKSLFVEAGSFPDPDYVKRAAFLATSDMTSGAEETHDWVIESFLDPAEFESTRIYQRLGGNTQDITNAVNNGCLFVTYGGHSGSGGWSGPAFNQANVQALSNAGLYGLVFGWSCNTAHYSYDECFGETWQRVANRGAAAYLSASDYIYWGDWEAWEPSRQLERYFFESFFVDEIWEVGPAWQSALCDFLADYGSNPAHEDVTRNFFEMMTLLGDPSLRLPEGIGFTLDADPASQDLCSPPADEAAYTIEVGQNMGFDEPVALSASGEPPGSNVSFSVNSVSPPFTSVMTVSNITGGSPGEYSIEITGTAPSLERSIFVELNLSDREPDPVTLISPPDGAIDVPRTPTLVWEPASQAVEYELEVATDADFVNVVYSATVTETSHTVDLYLETATLHYWHVRASNGCGTTGYSEAFRFTTIEQLDYFTEQFTGSFDLDNFTVAFIPDGSGDYYRVCGAEATELPTDPSGGTAISLSDDDYEVVNLGGGETVSLYGVHYGGFCVGSNGYITFTAGDSDYDESLTDHFSMPRISALFDDLNPGVGGMVSWMQLEDRAVVTYENVPEYGVGNNNTFQIEMFFQGEIRITWLNIDSNDSIAGLSEGNGLPGDFLESDLSAVGACAYPPAAEDDSVSTPANVPVAIVLIATDDGLPDPPGALTYVIESLPANGTLRDPRADVIDAVPYALVDGGNRVVYTPEPWYFGEDAFTFKANDGGEPPEGGDSNVATISIEVVAPEPELVYSFLLNSDPGWTTEGQWAFGQPTGGGSHDHDPTAGHTGSSVYGYNLAGDYTNNMPARYLTTTAINCRDLLDVELRFWRWLGVESSEFDHAAVDVSNDGSNWTEVWANPAEATSDTSWTQMAFDISAIAERESAVYIRWAMGPADESVTYPGWNIDDVEIWAVNTAPPCPGDLDGDGDVDLSDLSILLAHYGMTSGAEYEDGDLDGDGDVDLADLSALLAAYGTDCG
jgi:hypothetical protein